MTNGSIESHNTNDFDNSNFLNAGVREITVIGLDTNYDGDPANFVDRGGAPDTSPVTPFSANPDWAWEELSSNGAPYSADYAVRLMMTYQPNGGLATHDYYSDIVSETLGWIDHVIQVADQVLELTSFNGGDFIYEEDSSCGGKLVTVTVPDPGCGHGNIFVFESSQDNFSTTTTHHTGSDTSYDITFMQSANPYQVRVKMSNAQDATVYTSATSEFHVTGLKPDVTITTYPSEASADGTTGYTYIAEHNSVNCAVTN